MDLLHSQMNKWSVDGTNLNYLDQIDFLASRPRQSMIHEMQNESGLQIMKAPMVERRVTQDYKTQQSRRHDNSTFISFGTDRDSRLSEIDEVRMQTPGERQLVQNYGEGQLLNMRNLPKIYGVGRLHAR